MPRRHPTAQTRDGGARAGEAAALDVAHSALRTSQARILYVCKSRITKLGVNQRLPGRCRAMELYEAPPPETPKAALLVCPDVWGWNGGRVRAIADSLAAEGYFVVVGKFLSTPALDGGTDGDALPPGGAFSMDWIKNFPWSSQQSKVHNALAYCKTRVAALAPSLTCKFGVVGFCYGGHPACYASIEDETVRRVLRRHAPVDADRNLCGAGGGRAGMCI